MTTDHEPSPTAVAPSRSALVWLASFVALGTIAGAWALGVPAGGQPDEPAHLAKAYAVAHGQPTWQFREHHDATAPGAITATELHIEAPLAYQQLAVSVACAIRPPVQAYRCTGPLSDDTTTIVQENYVAAYPPLPYVLLGSPTYVLAPTDAMVASRLVMVVLCAGLLALALVAARRADRSGFLLGGVVLAITPGVLFFAAAPNPNGLEMAAAICLAASTVELLVATERAGAPIRWAPLVGIVVAAVLLVASRPASVAVMVVVVGSTAAALASRAQVRRLAASGRVRLSALVVGVASLLSLAWFVLARPLDTIVGIRQPPATRWEQITTSWSRFPIRAREMVGVFGWGDTPPPGWVVWGWLALVVGLVVAALLVGSGRQRTVLASLVALNVVLPTLAEVPRAEELGYIWQGRYSLPFAVAVPILAGAVVATRARLDARVLRAAVVPVAAFVGAALYASVLMTLTRFATGSTAPSVFGFLSEESWRPRGGGAAYVVVTGVAVTAYASLVVRLVWTATGSAARSVPRRSPSRSTG